jgi:ABC-type multidrug transport system ATPase subunit
MATHALEEAEAISTRVGMIGAGRLRAIGPPRTLCQAHGRGTHRLEIRCSANADERARQWVLSTFPSQELEQHGTVLRFEMTIGNMGLGSALSALASVCAEADSPILDFAVTRTSLEQIYLAISTEASALSQQAP